MDELPTSMCNRDDFDGPGRPAARLADRTVTEGIIVWGTPRVLISGMPAARDGEAVLDPLGLMKVEASSQSVFIEGRPAARMGDFLVPMTGRAGKGIPPRVGPGVVIVGVTTDPKSRTAEQALKEGSAVGPFAEARMIDIDQDGENDRYELEAAGLRWNFDKELDPRSGVAGGGGAFEGEILDVKAISTSTGEKLEGSMFSAALRGFVSDGAGSVLGVGAEAKLLHAEATDDLLVGYDESTGDAGIRMEAGLKAEALTGKVTGQAQAPLSTLFGVPPTLACEAPLLGEWEVGVKGDVGGDVGVVGAVGGFAAVYNSRDERMTLRGKLDAGFILGLGFDVSIYLQRSKSCSAGGGGRLDGLAPGLTVMGPSFLSTGDRSVFIGP